MDSQDRIDSIDPVLWCASYSIQKSAKHIIDKMQMAIDMGVYETGLFDVLVTVEVANWTDRTSADLTTVREAILICLSSSEFHANLQKGII